MDDPTQTPVRFRREGLKARHQDVLSLAILWCREEPARAGEVAPIPGGEDAPARILGRGEGPLAVGEERLVFFRQRPGQTLPTGPLVDPTLSRRQLALRPTGDGMLAVERLGRSALLVDGAAVDGARVGPGAVLEVAGSLLLWVCRRPPVLPGSGDPHPFGRADALGIVGESPRAWELRRQLGFVGRRDVHALLLGPSGSGKELAAQALHALSSRAARPLVSRNAATFPEGLIDAELFGSARNFPNAGMAERPGLIGEADGGALFLDEIGELPHAVQAHLLRVMDSGEHQRLGEAKARRADVRIIAATNRDPLALKEDLLARFPGRIVLPGLQERREDIPLIAAHLLRALARGDAEVAERFWEGDLDTGHPRWTPALVAELVTRPYATHVRQLRAHLMACMMSSPGEVLDLLPEGPRATGATRPAAGRAAPPPEGPRHPPEAPARPPVDPATIPRDALEAILSGSPKSQDEIVQELGLASRFVLYRLLRKHGLQMPKASRPWSPDDEGDEGNEGDGA